MWTNYSIPHHSIDVAANVLQTLIKTFDRYVFVCAMRALDSGPNTTTGIPKFPIKFQSPDVWNAANLGFRPVTSWNAVAIALHPHDLCLFHIQADGMSGVPPVSADSS